MQIDIFQIDAFTDKVFGGNPAAVCPLDGWPSDEILQKIALENNLSETAFFVKRQNHYELRWFTPTTEVDLCGHATLATAWVLRNAFDDVAFPVRFSTKSGELSVDADGDELMLDFPLHAPVPCAPPEGLLPALGVKRAEVLSAGEEYLVILEDEAGVKGLEPDLSGLTKLPALAVIVSAPGDTVDFVSRCFAPNVGIDEDPVTGAAHTILTPYWARRLGKEVLEARQVSRRGGKLRCRIAGDRVLLSGRAVKYMEGRLTLPAE